MNSRSQGSSSGWLCSATAAPQAVAVSRTRCRACPALTQSGGRSWAVVSSPTTPADRNGDPVPLPRGLLGTLREGAARDGAMLRIVADDGRRAALADAVQAAERIQRRDSARAGELARWAPGPGSARADGVPPASYPARAEHTSPDFPGRNFAHGHGWGLPPLSTTSPFRSAGVVGLLTTAGDRPQDWISAGQALQRILLTARTWGVAAALHTQPLEVGWLRESIRTQLSDGAYPQLILRFGAVTQVADSVRRPPGEVLPGTGCEHVKASDG